MAAIKGNKAKGRQSSKKKGYYENQKLRTMRNKNRRAAKRRTKAEYWVKRKADEAAMNDVNKTIGVVGAALVIG